MNTVKALMSLRPGAEFTFDNDDLATAKWSDPSIVTPTQEEVDAELARLAQVELDKKAAAEAEKFEVEIEDDTPPEDRGRKPMKEPVEDPTDDELASYDEKVQNRIKKFTRGYHDERRAKEQALREREAAENFAKQILEENKRLQQQLATGSQEYIETAKGAAETQLTAAKDTLM